MSALTSSLTAGLMNPAFLSALCFFAGVVLLDVLDAHASLDDSVGTAGAIVAAAATIVGAPVAAAISLVSACVVLFIRRSTDNRSRVMTLVVRPLGLLLGVAVIEVSALSGGQPSPMWRATVIAAALLSCEQLGRLALRSHEAGSPLSSQLRTSVTQRSALLLAEASTALLTVLLWGEMGAWGLLPVLAILVLIRQSYGTYLEIRDTYLASVSVLIRAAEAQEPDRRGHAERVSELSCRIGARCGLRSADTEMLVYAALFHDVDRLVDGLSGDERDAGGCSARVVESTGSFPNVVPILRVVDGSTSELPRSASTILTQAFIVALASDIDHVITGQSARAHASATARVAPRVPARIKARVTAAALELGYPIPAIDQC